MALFRFYSRLALGGDWHGLPLKAQIALCRQRFGKPPPGVRPEVQLTISHKHRMALIRKAQKEDLEARRGQEMIYLPPPASPQQLPKQDSRALALAGQAAHIRGDCAAYLQLAASRVRGARSVNLRVPLYRQRRRADPLARNDPAALPVRRGHDVC